MDAISSILQDPALAIHPPILYHGVCRVCGSFCVRLCRMLEGRMDQMWARWTRPWTTPAWAFLSGGGSESALGIGATRVGGGAVIDSGTGGNASFMPWSWGLRSFHSLASGRRIVQS